MASELVYGGPAGGSMADATRATLDDGAWQTLRERFNEAYFGALADGLSEAGALGVARTLIELSRGERA